MNKLQHHPQKVNPAVQILRALGALGLSFRTDGTRLIHKVQENKLAEVDDKRLTDLLLSLHKCHAQAVSLLMKS